MDSATRLKVLERLARSSTPEADEAVGRAFNRAVAILDDENKFDALEFSIDVLATVGFRRSAQAVSAINRFIRSIEARQLIYSDEHAALGDAFLKYRNAYTLISKSIKMLSGLRYLETPAVVETLLWASAHMEDSVCKEAASALSSLAKYNLSVYYGQGTPAGRGIGATPQLQVIATLEKRSDEELKTYLRGVLTLLEGLLSTSMEAASWSSTAVTLSRADTPADGGVVDVRRRSISLLKRLYNLAEATSQKLLIIRSMNAATRAERSAAINKEYASMISSNAQEVLAFFAYIANEEDLQIVQKIEHDSYWIHRHSPSDDVRLAALKVKAIIDSNNEYTIYKTLIGFEGIFGDWSAARQDESFELGSDSARIKAAHEFTSRIADEGFDIWRRRILTYAKTESNDLATFPVFYEFLVDVASLYPAFALDLLINDSDKLLQFLIPILRGLWDSEKRNELLLLIQQWIQQATPDQHSCLYACTKLFLSAKDIDIGLLGQLFDKASELKDTFVLRQIVSVAAARYTADEVRAELKQLFLRALSRLTELGDASWARDIWFRKEAKAMIAELSPDERREVLRNLRLLPAIDYQAEEVLAVIAEQEPLDVVEFFCARLYEHEEHPIAQTDRNLVGNETLPFEFHTLQEKLSGDPKGVIQRVLDCYLKDSSLFEFRGAKLLEIIFPQFSEAFEKALVSLVRDGGDVELRFVCGVLRAYSGETFIHPVAKQLIKRLPPGSSLVTEVEIALQSTGVVSGEYGMAEAYERKRLEVLDWLQDPDDRIREFAVGYISDLEAMRDSERVRAEESIALRKFEYGED